MSWLIPMPKILWVALPLLLAIAVWAVQVLRGRRPSRQAVNIVASVLLLGYVATTAGLGIFWVANQQLPVFDWHYLFGYGTVLLVALHLVFNLPRVWRFFAGRLAATGGAAPRPEARRSVLGALGVLASVGAAFMLGLRHGRSELRIEPSPAGGVSAGAGASEPAGSALALVERFHAFSSHSRAGLVMRAPAVDWGDPPAPFKPYRGASATILPAPGAARDTPLDLAALADILWHTAGVTATRGGLHLRASPSSGALFSTELYVAARAVPGLAPGLWHYDAQAHALVPWQDAAAAARLAAAAGGAVVPEAPAMVVATAIFRRTGHKYRDRTYRYVLADLGHALENLRVSAGALGQSARFATAFDESQAALALQLDEAEEGVLALVALGPPGPSHAASASMPEPVPPPGHGPRWHAPSATGRGLGVTALMHAAASLRSASASATARPAAPLSHPMPPAAIALPPPVAASRQDPLALIATRRSVRRYASAPLPLQALADILARMAVRNPATYSSAVRVDVVVHDVAGLVPGAYRYVPEHHALLARRVPLPMRSTARAAALDQDVIGDAAAVFVLSIDRAALAADPLGPARGYRHAMLEAGMVGERVYLEAAAQGLGACAVGAFYDDEAAALVGVDTAREWVVHFAALGVRA